MCSHGWHYSHMYNFWYIPEHPEAGRIFEEEMPPELKEEACEKP